MIILCATCAPWLFTRNHAFWLLWAWQCLFFSLLSDSVKIYRISSGFKKPFHGFSTSHQAIFPLCLQQVGTTQQLQASWPLFFKDLCGTLWSLERSFTPTQKSNSHFPLQIFHTHLSHLWPRHQNYKSAAGCEDLCLVVVRPPRIQQFRIYLNYNNSMIVIIYNTYIHLMLSHNSLYTVIFTLSLTGVSHVFYWTTAVIYWTYNTLIFLFHMTSL